MQENQWPGYSPLPAKDTRGVEPPDPFDPHAGWVLKYRLLSATMRLLSAPDDDRRQAAFGALRELDEQSPAARQLLDLEDVRGAPEAEKARTLQKVLKARLLQTRLPIKEAAGLAALSADELVEATRTGDLPAHHDEDGNLVVTVTDVRGWVLQTRLPLEEAAGRAGVSADELVEATRSGDLPAHHDEDGNLLVTVSDLNDFLGRRR